MQKTSCLPYHFLCVFEYWLSFLCSIHELYIPNYNYMLSGSIFSGTFIPPVAYEGYLSIDCSEQVISS